MKAITNFHTLSQEKVKAFPEFLSAKEVCAVLRIHYQTFLKLVTSGGLRAVRVGSQWRVREDALLEWLERAEKRTAKDTA